MGDITLNQIKDLMLYIIAFGTATATIVKAVKKAISSGFEPINKKIDQVDINATKNYLVARISELKNGEKLDDVQVERFVEQYDHYLKIGGNSYIKLEVEKLKNQGKI